MSMMKEVELQEKAAEQAKAEAARGGMDIMVKVEELKDVLVHAKEANDMVGLQQPLTNGYLLKIVLNNVVVVPKCDPTLYLAQHAGEIYGEKAILATEGRELQTRLLNLSEERDASLGILNEVFSYVSTF